MTSKFVLAALAVLTLAPSAFADVSKTMSGDDAIASITDLIPLDIRTNAFKGKTSKGKDCRLDLVLTNAEPQMLAIGLSSGSDPATNMLVEKANVIQFTYSPLGVGGLAMFNKTSAPAWKMFVRVPSLSSPNKRIVTIEGDHGTIDCAIDIKVTDN